MNPVNSDGGRSAERREEARLAREEKRRRELGEKNYDPVFYFDPN